MPLSLDTLAEFHKASSADGVFVFNSEGKVLYSIDVEYDINLTAMVSMILKMTNEFLEDIDIGPTQRILINANDGFFLAQKINSDEIVCAFSKNLKKSSLITLYMSKLK